MQVRHAQLEQPARGAHPGGVAEWSCSGLQSRVRRFDSDPRLQLLTLRSFRAILVAALLGPHGVAAARNGESEI